jgi:hypothetical protein
MEIGFAKGVATVVGLADGTASLYLTSGGGVLGAGARADVRSAAIRLCETAAGLAEGTTLTSTFPRPHAGGVRFYLLTDTGVRTVETDEETLRGRKHRLSPLYAAGQSVISALRDATKHSNKATAANHWVKIVAFVELVGDRSCRARPCRLQLAAVAPSQSLDRSR